LEYCIQEAKDSVDYEVQQERKQHFEKLKTWIRNKVPMYVRQPLAVC